MYVKIRNILAKPGDKDDIIHLSKKSLISEVKQLVYDETGISVNKQRLFYKGKQLHDDCCVMDYNIQLNDVIQIMEINQVSSNIDTTEDSKKSDESDHMNDEDSDKENEYSEPSSSRGGVKSVKTVKVLTEVTANSAIEKANSKYYKIGDSVDFIHEEYGSWFEGEITEIFKTKQPENTSENNLEPSLLFKIRHHSEQGPEHEFYDLPFDGIKPRSYYKLEVPELEKDKIILVNYNVEQPSTRGYWYTFKIKHVNRKMLQGTILVGKGATPIEKCTVRFLDEVLRLEEPVLLEERDDEKIVLPPIRKTVYYCEKCKDVDTILCKECGCKICSGKDEVDTIILCDECNYGYHIRCLTPPLSEVPSDPEWFCISCRVDVDEIVKAGEKIKFSKKKAKMASAKSDATKRDWGRGMACAGRTKQCTIVPINHFGQIPGIEVGTRWIYRMQTSEAGVHRSLVAGIHGRASEGAFSLVLSGGYEDDVDYGNEFLYTGSGGRDLSNNKRVSTQSRDQKLSLNNKALALNCNTPLNKMGGEAEDWTGGKPVRVIRTWKFAKHSEFAPPVGCRYDGLYKVVKYFREAGKSGFMVWRYLLRRDDPAPAPWEPNATEYPIIFPAGYLEGIEKKKRDDEEKRELKKLQKQTKTKKPTSRRQQRQSNNQSSDEPSTSGGAHSSDDCDTPPPPRGRKRKNQSFDGESTLPSRKQERRKAKKTKNDENSVSKRVNRKLSVEQPNPDPYQKKIMVQTFVLPPELSEIINNDDYNDKVWEECKTTLEAGKPVFLEKVAETFTCVCCQELVCLPITTECKHNVCKSCLKRSFKAAIYSCPYCRYDLGENYVIVVNDNLSKILLELFPGYNVGR